MYASFKGTVEEKNKEKIIIEVSNIGYEIYLPESEIEQIELHQNIKIYTYLHVREDDMKLYGFLTKENLEFYKKLISVSGVGPKVALGIISNVNADDMCIAIATENIMALKAVPGIGPKMAQKIVFELKNKTVKVKVENENIKEAITALQVLGYTERQVKEVITKIDEIESDSVETIIRKVLKEMQNM